MRFEEAYDGCKSGRLTQAEAALLLGVCDRTFRRYMVKYDEGGLEALMDKRLTQASHRCAPVDEVIKLTEQYRSRYLVGMRSTFIHGIARMGVVVAIRGSRIVCKRLG